MVPQGMDRVKTLRLHDRKRERVGTKSPGAAPYRRRAQESYLARMLDADVLIIGGGMAGVAAALAVADAGARAALVRRGPGATALSAGGWVGVPPESVRSALAAAGLPLDMRPVALPHPDGRVLQYDAAPIAHGAADLWTAAAGARDGSVDRTSGEQASTEATGVLVCGVAGLPSFRAAALAALWADAAPVHEGDVGGGRSRAFGAVTLSLADTPAGGWSAVALAARLERDPALLAAPLAAAAREHAAAVVIVPAVLGLDAHGRVHSAVRAAVGVPIGEALGVAPSVPGWRLDRALLHALERAGVTVVTGTVTDRTATGGAVERVAIAASTGSIVIRPSAVVLATGRFIGGGVTAGAQFIESALRIELALDGASRLPVTPAESLAHTHADRSARQPVLGIGVRTDGDGRPVTPGGDLAFRNVFIAGSIRAGAETAALGLGAAARDGWRVGALAAAAAARN
jgi:glycerol-3-phosphate dehydrogenase subunit B